MKGRPLVLDCSILAKALVPESLSDEARSVLGSGRYLMAPDLLPIELANVLWKKVQRGALTADEARGAHQGITALAPIRILPSGAYHPRALELALEFGRSFYDALYLAVAETENALFVSADEKLVNALAATRLGVHIHWLGAGTPP
ncbi:MAG: type II toxin-antitoxin system VapC family toxin [Holophaga sp.]|nr:type II toxin-antitoxin system VapC family toxin [Holophaga sp.]